MKIALASIESRVWDIQGNLRKIQTFAQKAAEDNCGLIAFPEGALTGYTSNQDQLSPLREDSPVFLELGGFARQHKIVLLFGALTRTGENFYNVYYCADMEGKVSSYKKTHLGEREKELFLPGNSLSLLDAGGVKIGIALCLECHVPEIFSHYARLGADLVLIPSAAPISCGSRKEVWNKILPARGYDNGLTVGAVNAAGENGSGLSFPGGIMAVGAKGENIAQDFSGAEGMLIFEIEPEGRKPKRFLKYKRESLYRF